jgi:hypothetical protein
MEQAGHAAKICGAGAVAGEHAGIVLIVAEEKPQEICHRFGYELEEVQGDARGLHSI